MGVIYFEQGTCERCGHEQTAPADKNLYGLNDWAFVRAVAFHTEGSVKREPMRIEDSSMSSGYEEGHALICATCASEFWAWWNEKSAQ